MREKTISALDEFLGDFNMSEPEAEPSLKMGAPITIWLPAEDKARYDKLQKLSRRRFSKKAREVLQALMEAVEAKTA